MPQPLGKSKTYTPQPLHSSATIPYKKHPNTMYYSVPKRASVAGCNPSAAEDLKKLVLHLEPKNNIHLTQKELKELFNALGSRSGSWRAWRAMRNGDENGDGFITHDEMAQLLMYCKKHGFVPENHHQQKTF